MHPLPGNYIKEVCMNYAVIWLKRFSLLRYRDEFDENNPPQWVENVLNPPHGWEDADNRAKRFHAYHSCALFLNYTKRKKLPLAMVMAIRCRYPEPDNIYTGYIHIHDEDPDQFEQEPENDFRRVREVLERERELAPEKEEEVSEERELEIYGIMVDVTILIMS